MSESIETLFTIIAAFTIITTIAVFFFVLMTVSSPVLPACAQEDSTNCIWDAEERGNGTGRSFVNLDGTVYYEGETHE